MADFFYLKKGGVIRGVIKITLYPTGHEINKFLTDFQT